MKNTRLQVVTIVGLGLCVMLMAQGCGRGDGDKGADTDQGARQLARKGSRAPVEGENTRIDDLGMDLVWVEAGRFAMGTAVGFGRTIAIMLEAATHGRIDIGAYDDHENERPVREVRITRGYWMGKYEVTNSEYQRFVRESGYNGRSDADPDYLLGLHDMSGNVFEWCHDWYQDSYSGLSTTDPTGPTNGSDRVCRGGGWAYSAYHCRVAHRNRSPPSNVNTHLGFRVVLAPVP